MNVRVFLALFSLSACASTPTTPSGGTAPAPAAAGDWWCARTMGMSECYRSLDECRAKMSSNPGSFDDPDCWSAPAAWCVVDDVMTTCYAEEPECHEAEGYIEEYGGAVVQPCAWND